MSKAKAPKPLASSLDWIPATGGYAVALDGGRVVARSATGSVLKSVPAALKDDPAVEQLRDLREWLERHEKECLGTVETWMVRSLPVPTTAIKAIWEDPSWQRSLRDAVVVPLGADGSQQREMAGFLRFASEDRGLGVVTLDGETRWLDPESVTIPHPVLILELEDYRDFATEAQIEQSIAQLYRETWPKPQKLAPGTNSVDAFSGGRFKQLLHATSRCRLLGYRVSGGYSVTRVWENKRLIEARYWIGSDAPEVEAETGDLIWVDGADQVELEKLGPVAYSEGMRMASSVYAGRFVEETEQV